MIVNVVLHIQGHVAPVHRLITHNRVRHYQAATGLAAVAGALASVTMPLLACFSAIFIALCLM